VAGFGAAASALVTISFTFKAVCPAGSHVIHTNSRWLASRISLGAGGSVTSGQDAAYRFCGVLVGDAIHWTERLGGMWRDLDRRFCVFSKSAGLRRDLFSAAKEWHCE